MATHTEILENAGQTSDNDAVEMALGVRDAHTATRLACSPGQHPVAKAIAAGMPELRKDGTH